MPRHGRSGSDQIVSYKIKIRKKYMIFDKNHNEVKIGSIIKVLYFDQGFISSFPCKERERIIIRKDDW